MPKQNLCVVSGCSKPYFARGYCRKHYVSPSKCSVADCDTPVRSHGFCVKHLRRFEKHGSPHVTNGKGLDFIKKVALTHDSDDCLLWPFISKKSKSRYGRLSINNRTINAHAYVCELVHGTRPDGHLAAHGCGNPTCVNPRHLRWATPLENSSDRYIHGTILYGTRTKGSKVSPEQVREIRALAGKFTQKEIGKRYGLTKNGVGSIISRRSWAWLD